MILFFNAIAQDLDPHADIALQCTTWRISNFDRSNFHFAGILYLEINLDPPGMVGTIDQTCNILNVAEDAYDAASGLCDGQ